jgi:periplasmic protein TonB
MKNYAILSILILFSINVFSQTKDSTGNFNIEKDKEAIIIRYEEQNATFQGGTIADFRNWINSQIQYPDSALKINAQGTVVIRFTINNLGILVNPIIIKSSGFKVLDDEAIRVVSTSPKWVPGKIGERNIHQQFNLPIAFKLGE